MEGQQIVLVMMLATSEQLESTLLLGLSGTLYPMAIGPCSINSMFEQLYIRMLSTLVYMPPIKLSQINM